MNYWLNYVCSYIYTLWVKFLWFLTRGKMDNVDRHKNHLYAFAQQFKLFGIVDSCLGIGAPMTLWSRVQALLSLFF